MPRVGVVRSKNTLSRLYGEKDGVPFRRPPEEVESRGQATTMWDIVVPPHKGSPGGASARSEKSAWRQSD